ncbi:Signal transduction histidine kinase [Chishuiella changwenlii]|uniref:histidine kinase n=1 Tax=Chishuiella changwenlii TaxID=1434701 RepID=A0A1M6VCL2_9FLAO|nr:HAMP domain-containing sensor histidine kinase [Chishuiella changwenlii]GGF09726.1 two-component sensor histidine kinase [Chishuiella changwenlii]SHK79085.1 Signal transduction histidine kinase [Chishuiella changwenlii]
MKLKHRLSLYSVFIFSVVVLIISAIIYFSFSNEMERKELQSLESKTLLAAIYYLEQDELPVFEHNNIKTQLLKSISRNDIMVVDKNNQIFGGKMAVDENISKKFIDNIRHTKSDFFVTKTYFYRGLYYEDNQGDFVVITRESKQEFNERAQSLLHILISVFLIGLLFIYVFSNYLGYLAYEPIIKIIDQIKERDSKNFTQPLVLKKSYTEIEDLIINYNHFIDRISQTFTVQKNFIDYVSHELRTPITALLGTLEVTKQKKRSEEEYKEVINQLQQYTNDLQETLDQMMLLSGAKTSFEFQSIRIDEVVWQVIENAILYHQAKINVDIKVENNNLLSIQGNEKLLELAFNNLVSNAIKYSDNKPIHIQFLEVGNHLEIQIIDQGIGILEEDLVKIKQNFFRGKNTQKYQGKGVGLSMANVILVLHQIQLEISQNKPEGTIIRLVL